MLARTTLHHSHSIALNPGSAPAALRAESLTMVQGSMEVLGVEWKLVRDDLHRLRQDLAERSVRLNTLRAKHATLVAKHGGSAEEAQESEVCLLLRGPALLDVCMKAVA